MENFLFENGDMRISVIVYNYIWEVWLKSLLSWLWLSHCLEPFQVSFVTVCGILATCMLHCKTHICVLHVLHTQVIFQLTSVYRNLYTEMCQLTCKIWGFYSNEVLSYGLQVVIPCNDIGYQCLEDHAEAAGSSETLVSCHVTAKHHITEDHNLNVSWQIYKNIRNLMELQGNKCMCLLIRIRTDSLWERIYGNKEALNLLQAPFWFETCFIMK